jgi:hypothetical protein
VPRPEGVEAWQASLLEPGRAHRFGLDDVAEALGTAAAGGAVEVVATPEDHRSRRQPEARL